MEVLKSIAQHLKEVHYGGNWTEVSIADALIDVAFEEANTQTIMSVNTIAMLLHHITYWNRIIVQRANGTVPFINAANGFNVPDINSVNDWEMLKQDNLRSAEELAAVILNFDADKLNTPILPEHDTAYRNFQGSVEHVHYHLGQMVMIKKLVKVQK